MGYFCQCLAIVCALHPSREEMEYKVIRRSSIALALGLLAATALAAAPAQAATICQTAPNGSQYCFDDGKGANTGVGGSVGGGSTGGAGAVPPPPAQVPVPAQPAPAPAPYVPPAPAPAPYVPAPAAPAPMYVAPAPSYQPPAAPQPVYQVPAAPAPVYAAPVPAAGQAAITPNQPADVPVVEAEAPAAAESVQNAAEAMAAPSVAAVAAVAPVGPHAGSYGVRPVQDIVGDGGIEAMGVAATTASADTISPVPWVLFVALIVIAGFVTLVVWKGVGVAAAIQRMRLRR
ncbi:Meckel syndrome type 1 protein [Pseudarthrobacter equi]|uniref:Meckel syndrome type 1 protein n=1 Tax=Pseudarthrobacter equi TaxID=728066 RepID=A0A1H2A7H4_9MICC|nr:Meckel syndrome type 1 protein [Pseudarthrobacter equi]